MKFFVSLFFCLQAVGVAAPLSLSVKEAVALAIQNNLATQTAAEKQKEAHGRELEALSRLLPNFYATASQFNLTSNLAASGFPLKSFPVPINPLIGPYNTFDARLELSQALFNLSAYHRHQVSQIDFQIAKLQSDLAEEQVAAAAEVAYLNVMAADEALAASKADVTLAQSLRQLALDQHKAGVATGIDVARAETRLSQEEVALTKAETALTQSQLQFKRLLGVPLETQVALADSLSAHPSEPLAVDDLLKSANADRFELKIASAQLRSSQYALEAANGEGIPTLDFSANYGESGNTWGTLALPTRAIGARMNIPIFNGELTAGHIVEAESRKREAELIRRDTAAQVEEDVRLSRETLFSTGREVDSAKQSLKLSERELALARDRFQAGLGDNLEVVQAETSLEDARGLLVNALADYNRARINLAAALGAARSFEFGNEVNQ